MGTMNHSISIKYKKNYALGRWPWFFGWLWHLRRRGSPLIWYFYWHRLPSAMGLAVQWPPTRKTRSRTKLNNKKSLCEAEKRYVRGVFMPAPRVMIQQSTSACKEGGNLVVIWGLPRRSALPHIWNTEATPYIQMQFYLAFGTIQFPQYFRPALFHDFQFQRLLKWLVYQAFLLHNLWVLVP